MTLLTAALHLNNQVKSFIIWSDKKSKGKEVTLVFLEYSYELLATENSNLENIIWSDGPNSEFNIVSYFLKIMLLRICKGGLGSSFFKSYKNCCMELLFRELLLLCTMYTFTLKSSFRIQLNFSKSHTWKFK